MSYMSIQNLYQNQEVLMFRELYALEKIHGTSTHITFTHGEETKFSSGGVKNHKSFVELFDREALAEAFKAVGCAKLVLYGEAYGGSIMKMSNTYGKQMKFIAFEVKIDDVWLAVPNAEDVAKQFGLEFVHYVKIPAELAAINEQRDIPSIQAMRNGMNKDMPREGTVLRPLIELRKNNDERIMSKHKHDQFRETKTPREVSPEKLAILAEANAIADEWVTEMRLTHVLGKLPQGINVESAGLVVKLMIEDVLKESKDEIVNSKEARKAIGRAAGQMFVKRVKSRLEELAV